MRSEVGGRLRMRIDAATFRVAQGLAPMRVPADPTDVDIVLADCKLVVEAAEAVLERVLEVYRPEYVTRAAAMEPESLLGRVRRLESALHGSR